MSDRHLIGRCTGAVPMPTPSAVQIPSFILGLREGCPEENGHNHEGDYHEHDRRKTPILPLPFFAELRRGDRTFRWRARLSVNVNLQVEPNARHHAKRAA